MELSFSFKPCESMAGGVRPAIMLVLICALVLPVLCVYPFYSDIDIHHCIAIELIRATDLPYRSTFVANLPGIVDIHLLAIMLFGTSVLGFRLFEIMFQVLTVLTLYRVSRLWFSGAPAILGCFTYAVMYVHGPANYLGHPDCFAVLPLLFGVGALILAFRSHTVAGLSSVSSRRILLLVAGMAYGTATCFRPTFGLMLFLPIVFLFDPRRKMGRRSFYVTLLGFTIAVAVCVAIYAPTFEGIRALYTAIIVYNFEVKLHSFAWHDYSKRLFLIVTLILSLGIIVWMRHRKGQSFSNAPQCPSESRFLIATFLSLAIGIGSMGRFAGYHLTPFFALFLPVITSTIWEWSRENRQRGQLFLFSLIVTVVFLYPWHMVWRIFLAVSGTAPFPNSWYSDPATAQVVSYTLQHTNSSDTVEVATFHPSVRWRIDRQFATRFSIPECMLLKQSDGTFAAYQREWQTEYICSIERMRPKFYLVENLVDNSGTHSTLDLIFELPGLRELLDREYRVDTAIASYVFYVRKEQANLHILSTR
jgi:hypothetical protein